MSAGIVGRTRVIFRVLLQVHIDGRWVGGRRRDQTRIRMRWAGGGRQRGLDIASLNYVFCAQTDFLLASLLLPSRGPKLFRFHRFFLFVFLMPSSLPRPVVGHCPPVRPSIHPSSARVRFFHTHVVIFLSSPKQFIATDVGLSVFHLRLPPSPSFIWHYFADVSNITAVPKEIN